MLHTWCVVRLLIILRRLWCGFAQLELCAHLLDLRCLLLELLRELRDRCLQLLNFVIQHGLALRRRRCGTRVVRVHTISAKLAGSIHSNLTNGDAVPDLGVRGDTVDKAGSGTRKDAADAYD